MVQVVRDDRPTRRRHDLHIELTVVGIASGGIAVEASCYGSIRRMPERRSKPRS